MTLENLIYRSIQNYPSLFYYPDLKTSRIAVLEHMFLTLGNGAEFDNNGEMNREYTVGRFDKKIKINDLKKRINNGEKIVQIYRTETYKTEDISFLNDLKEGYIDNLPKNYKAEVYPDGNTKRSPTPYSSFCFYYCNFVEINPHYRKYNYNTIEDMSVEELAESKKLIKPDYAEGIVEVFKWALDWINSPEYYKNYSFNIQANSYIFGEFKKEFDSEKSEEFRKTLPKEVNSPEEAAKFLCEQKKSDLTCIFKKIIKAFS